MTKEARGRGSATTIDDLPDSLRIALRSGFRAAYWFGDRVDAGAGSDDAEPQRTYADGKRLAEAVSMLISADLADYGAEKAHYDRVADELNERYGSDVVVRGDELRGSLGPGFRPRSDP